MNKIRRAGIILIIIGFFIPSILYPFTSVTIQALLMQVAFAKAHVYYNANHLRDLEVVFVKGVWKESQNAGHSEGPNSRYVFEDEPVSKGSQNVGHFEGRYAVPYRYTIAFGITLVFIGISLFALSRKQKILT